MITLFNELKGCITSSLILARFDPDKFAFLKIDRSSEGIGWILMKPTDDEDYVAAAACLKKTSNCLFDLSLRGIVLNLLLLGHAVVTKMNKTFIHSLVMALVGDG